MARDLILDCKDVVELAIESFRPQAVAILRIDELNGDAQPVSSFADAAFQQRFHAKSLPNLARVHILSAKREAGRPSRDVKTANFRQDVENLLCYTVTEVFLVTFCAKIDERQYGDRANTFFLLLCWRAEFCNAGRRRFLRIALHIDGVQTNCTNTFQGSLA